MASFFARHGAGEILARYSFIEPLLEGRRVLELGAAAATAGASALLLAERGAAVVLSLVEGGSLEEARAAGHHPFVRFDDVPLDSLPEGAFDLILLADGAPLADDPARITLLRRLLADQGHLVTAIPAAGGRSLAELAGDATPVQSPVYETFIAALTEHFPWVEVATQSASVGYVIAVPPPEGEEPEVSIDGSQAGDAEAAAYLAICGEGPSGLAGITMVALPSRLLLDDAAGSRAAALAEAARASGTVAALEARLAALTGADEAVAAELAGLRQERASLVSERDALLAERQRAAEEREALLQDREAALAGEAEARAALARQGEGGRDADQTAEKLRSVEALCDAEREAGAAARADAERLGSLLGLRDRELGEVRAQQESLRQRLAEAEMEAARVGEERTRAVTELAERSSLGVETEAAVRAARAEAQAARSLLESALARADTAEARVQELEEGVDQRGGELERLREEVVTARGEAEVALREIDEARGEASRATALLAELRVELRSTTEALEEARAQLDAARGAPAPAAEAERLSEEATRLAAQLDEVQRQADREREQLVGQLDDARVIIQGAADRLREMEAQRASAEAEAQLQRERAGEATARAAVTLAEARQLAEATEGQVAEIGAELQAVRWEKEELEQKLAALEQRDGREAGEGGEAAAEATRLRGELEALRAGAEPLRAELARLRGGQEARDLEVDGLRGELDRVQAELAERSTAPALDVAPDVLSRMVVEKAELAAALVERDQRILRLQREVTDKTERLGRLAHEVGELKAKGIGKIFR